MITIHLQLSWDNYSAKTSTGEYKNSNKSLISTQSPVEMLGSQDAIYSSPQRCYIPDSNCDVMGAAIFMTTAAQLSLTYVHQVSQYVDGSLVPRPPMVQLLYWKQL